MLQNLCEEERVILGALKNSKMAILLKLQNKSLSRLFVV